MPKKPKTLTKTLYTYVTPKNNEFIRKQARRLKMPYSVFINQIFSIVRTNTRVAKVVTGETPVRGTLRTRAMKIASGKRSRAA